MKGAHSVLPVSGLTSQLSSLRGIPPSGIQPFSTIIAFSTTIRSQIASSSAVEQATDSSLGTPAVISKLILRMRAESSSA